MHAMCAYEKRVEVAVRRVQDKGWCASLTKLRIRSKLKSSAKYPFLQLRRNPLVFLTLVLVGSSLNGGRIEGVVVAFVRLVRVIETITRA